MSEPSFDGAQVRARTRFEAAAVGLRLAHGVATRFGLAAQLDPGAPAAQGAGHDTLLAALRFIVEQARAFGLEPGNQGAWREDIRKLRAASDPHPLSRLAQVSPDRALGDRVADLVLLAGLPELHECYAALFRLLHPQGLPCPTATLALHWLEGESRGDAAGRDVRDSVEDLLLHSALARIGLVRLAGEGPWHGRQLQPGPGVWEALCGRPPREGNGTLVIGESGVPGLDRWLGQEDVRRAVAALRAGHPCVVALLGGSEAMRATRIGALLGAAGVNAVQARVEPSHGAAAAADAYCAAFMQGACPWLEIAPGGGARLRTPGLRWELPVLASSDDEYALPELELPVLALRAEPLPALSRRAMWQALLPQLGEHAAVLAVRYPLDPDEALDVARDLALRQRVERRGLGLDDVGDCLRARTLWRARPGARRVVPRAGWDSLLLPAPGLAQLRQAVMRVHQQITVLDDWGFDQGRQDRRGLRMLFYGPPGTGKTLAAEAMARALGTDMLVVDIASLVSKWIGETEKNLAAVFELAERSRALLLFDEADALFGRRTEAADANDRYANLETAFLLQRIEAYTGVAVLTTNLRNNLDSAFTRRFEYIVEFPAPDLEARQALWQLHLPRAAPRAPDVDLGLLAAWYPLSGAQIRNAALGAAFLAAADCGAISQAHFLRAIEREYDKAGKAHPGNPPPQPHHRQEEICRSA